MAKSYKIKVFGKPGCAKCKTLNQRLDKLLEETEWADFEKEYCDVETVDGLVAFASAECINPQRIPAMLITRKDEKTGNYTPVPTREPKQTDEVCGKSKLYQYVGLQTDYTPSGKGLISPKMITAVLEEARA
ncbi:MAG: hypothetical protein ISR85_05170 [Kiritimatiellales bacterium]|nr:hypothetical protein [Kiritimatiellota bacterium]MBL7012303.1 hypothetical protein [Kiritimatiellales bacterium]